MSGSSFLVVLLLVAAAIGALFLFSAPSPSPATEAVGAAAGSAVTSPQAAVSSGPPWADAGADRVVGERESIRLAGSGGVSGGGAVAFQWTSSGGLGFLADPTRPDSAYTASSACDCCQAVTLTLSVTDRFGTTASDSMIVQIRDPIACRPTNACGERIPAVVPACPCPSAVVKSRCPQPDIPCAGPCVTEAPAARACAHVPVPCRCATGCEAAWDSAWPQIVPALSASDRPMPRIIRQYPAHVTEGSATPLRAVVANPACSSVCFRWAASQGWFERADTLEPIYHAPLIERRDGEKVTITFTIQDSTGQPSVDQIRLQVDDAPPS